MSFAVQLLSLILLFSTPWTAACQASLSFTISQSFRKLMSIESVMLSNHLILCHHLLFIGKDPDAGKDRRFFVSGGLSNGASASALVLPVNIQDWFPLRLTGLISLQSRGFQEYSPTPQCKSINSLVLSLLYCPTLTSIHNYRKNHSFVYMDLWWQSNVSAF